MVTHQIISLSKEELDKGTLYLRIYLFWRLKLWASKVRQEQSITGIKVKDNELKVLQYADDTNGLIDDVSSAKAFLNTVKEFGLYSGLMLNKEKTEAMWLGSSRQSQTKPLGILWPDRPLNILGVHVSYDPEESYTHNFDKVLRRLR